MDPLHHKWGASRDGVVDLAAASARYHVYPRPSVGGGTGRPGGVAACNAAVLWRAGPCVRGGCAWDGRAGPLAPVGRHHPPFGWKSNPLFLRGSTALRTSSRPVAATFGGIAFGGSISRVGHGGAVLRDRGIALVVPHEDGL